MIDSDRGAILERLKTALNRSVRPPEEARARLLTPVESLIPARGAGDGKNKIKQFIEEAEKVDTTVARISSLGDLPQAVTSYLASQNLPTKVRAAPAFSDVSWSDQPLLTVETGIAEAVDTVGVSRAFGGVAETGTLVFLSGPNNPTSNNFLPPILIAVIAAEDIAGNYEQVWDRIRSQYKTNPDTSTILPRTVNWITGPSRSADIELTLLLGAHGPQRLHIVVVGDDD